MKTRLSLTIGLLGMLALATVTRAYPEPSRVPLSWELKFKYAEPKRIVVEVPGEANPKAYWYVTYTVTNNTNEERQFMPAFHLLTKSGKLIRSDKGVPKIAFDKIKQAAGNKLLQSPLEISGTLNVGEDQAKDGVAIWEEPEAEMGSFNIFVSGLSGESTQLKDDNGQPVNDADGKPVILFKTLQLNYTVSGDEVYPGIDAINKTHERWVMR